MKKDINFLMSKKQAGQKITMLTCYDYPTALLEEKAGIDVIFAADSVGTNILGYESATQVTMADMIHHLKAVARGVTDAYLLVDMPYGSYDTPEQALENAKVFLSHGADGVKLEGWSEQEEVVRRLSENNIEVCAHIGHNPQTHGNRAWTHGVTYAKAKVLIQTALILERAGVQMIVFEKVSEEVSRILTEKLKIPTIGIGAGRFCDGQVLVITDILGIGRDWIHSKQYQNYQNLTFNAICEYKAEVENGRFPTEENVVSMDEGKLVRVEKWMKRNLMKFDNQNQ